MTSSNLILLCLLISTALLAVVDVDSKANDLTWQKWKQRYDKQYVDSGEEVMRRDIWQQQVDEITQHNLRYEMGLESYKQGLNKFSDLTWDEFRQDYLMSGLVEGVQEQKSDRPTVDMNRLPKSIDWRKKGYVTSVKDQGNCGSCWTFSVAGTLEGQLANKTGKTESLSTQQLVDCDTRAWGCSGGWPYLALEYTQRNGLESDANYPYVAKKQECNYNENKKTFKNSGMIYAQQAGEERLAEMVVNHGPISVCIHVTSDFCRYKSGLFVTDQCTSVVPSHAVLAVGYGGRKGKEFWTVKNSWGETWGDRGYIKMARNRNDMCNIAFYPVAALM